MQYGLFSRASSMLIMPTLRSFQPGARRRRGPCLKSCQAYSKGFAFHRRHDLNTWFAISRFFKQPLSVFQLHCPSFFLSMLPQQMVGWHHAADVFLVFLCCTRGAKYLLSCTWALKYPYNGAIQSPSTSSTDVWTLWVLLLGCC